MKITQQEHNELIGVWRRRVFEANNGKCVCCGNTATDAHHIVSRGSSSWTMKYDPQNGVPLCHSCHHRFHIGIEITRKQIHSFYERTHDTPIDWLFYIAKQPVKRNAETLELVRLNLGISAGDILG